MVPPPEGAGMRRGARNFKYVWLVLLPCQHEGIAPIALGVGPFPIDRGRLLPLTLPGDRVGASRATRQACENGP
jgi:hypothetical protein